MNKRLLAPGFILVIFLAVLSPDSAEAASLYIDPPFSALNKGDAGVLAVRLDVDEDSGECVNAVDAVVSYSKGIEPTDISIGESILSIWVEEPLINRDDRTITFAGGIPNGYCGRVVGDPQLTNKLAEIIVRSPGFSIGASSDTSTSTLSFSNNSTVYLNDGFGTKASLNTFPATISLGDKPGSAMEDPWQEIVDADTTAPEEFSISLQRDEKAFSKKYYIVFNTSDKQTGIDRYEVIEEKIDLIGSFQWGRADAPWVKARSPYVLEDQTLNSTIRVKAVDKTGNEYIATLVPDESLRTASAESRVAIAAIVAGIGLVLMLAIVAVVFAFRRKRRGQASGFGGKEDESDEVFDEEISEEEVTDNSKIEK